MMFCAGNYTYRIQWVKVDVFKCSGLSDNQFAGVVKRKMDLKMTQCPQDTQLPSVHLLRESHSISKRAQL